MALFQKELGACRVDVFLNYLSIVRMILWRIRAALPHSA
jgi:hypothetical protein